MRKRILWGLVFFLSLGLLRLFTDPAGEPGSTFSAGPNGTKALYLLLEESGRSPRHYQYTFDELAKSSDLGRDTTLFLIGPKDLGAPSALLDWVRAGNRAVVFDTPGRVLEPLLKALMSNYSHDLQAAIESTLSSDTTAAVHSSSSPLASNVSVLTRPSGSDVSPPLHAQPVVGTHESARGFVVPLDAGELWYFSGSEPISNRFIDEHDNLRLFFQIATAGKTVLFDEFHHGFPAPLPEAKVDAWNTILLLAASLLLWLTVGVLSRSRRFGGARSEDHEGISASTDFAIVVGRLYSEHQAASVLKNYVASWRQRVALQLGIAAHYSTREFVTELVTREIEQERAATQLQAHIEQLENAQDHSDQAYEKHIQALEAFTIRHASSVRSASSNHSQKQEAA